MVESRALPEVIIVEVRELLGVVMGESGIELEVFLIELRELLRVHVVELRAPPRALLTEVSPNLDIKLQSKLSPWSPMGCKEVLIPASRMSGNTSWGEAPQSSSSLATLKQPFLEATCRAVFPARLAMHPSPCRAVQGLPV